MESQSQPGDPTPKAPPPGSVTPADNSGAGFGVGVYALLVVGGGLAWFAYQYLQQQQDAPQPA